MKVYVQTDRGRVRPINEDAYYLPQGAERFCAVADGMGGHNAGEVASALACMEFSDRLRGADAFDADTIRDAVAFANTAVFERSRQDPHLSGMGTTFTALAQEGGSVWIAHVGDSRAYLIRDDAVMQITMDHTLVAEMVLQGIITEREAKYHPKRNYITRALGTDAQIEVDVTRIALEPGDIFFLCSDGLSNHVEPDEILRITRKSSMTWQEKLKTLVETALDNGSTDNVTAMYAFFEEEDAQ